jgi:hypothetical protein
MDNLLSALYFYPGGWLADCIGYKRFLELFAAFLWPWDRSSVAS